MYFSRVFITFIPGEKRVLVRPHLHLKPGSAGPQSLGASVGSKPPADFLLCYFWDSSAGVSHVLQTSSHSVTPSSF